MTTIEQSNYLPELAARIRAEHEATAAALRAAKPGFPEPRPIPQGGCSWDPIVDGLQGITPQAAESLLCGAMLRHLEPRRFHREISHYDIHPADARIESALVKGSSL
jgi:hypothetical protein